MCIIQDLHGWSLYQSTGCRNCKNRRSTGTENKATGVAASAALAAMNASVYAASKASASAASALGSIKDLTITDLAITDLDAWSVAEINASETQSYHMQRWFSDVPSSERVIQDYACALHSGNGHDVSALFPNGRVFISANYMSFSCDVPGQWKRCVVPLSCIRSIEKAKTGRLFGLISPALHNAIHITMDPSHATPFVPELSSLASGPQHATTMLLTSFLFHKAAYKCLVKSWRLSQLAPPQHSNAPMAPCETTTTDDDDDDNDDDDCSSVSASVVAVGTGEGEHTHAQHIMQPPARPCAALATDAPHTTQRPDQQPRDTHHDLLLTSLLKQPQGGGGGV